MALENTKSIFIYISKDIEVQFERILKTNRLVTLEHIPHNKLFSAASSAQENRDDIIAVIKASVMVEESKQEI